jgi:outer membrane protein OmpA-like peptidoglycan-associated protein
MRTIRKLMALVALATVSTGAAAQTSGTFELGAFGHFTRLDKDILLGDNSLGVGARLGFFAHRNLALEAEYSFGTIKENVRDVSGWAPFRGMVVLNIPIATRAKLLLGAGYKFDTWMGDTTKNEFEDGFTGIGGLRLCLNNGWSVRPEVVLDINPSPNFQRPVESTSRHVGFRIGVSKFLGRGSDTCAGAPSRAPVAPPPPFVPPVVVQPPPPPPQTPAPTVNLFASPTSINAGQSSTLSWSSTNATTCSAPWTTSGASSGSQSVSPTTTTTYSITCTGAGGSASSSATVNVAAQAPREIFRLEGVYFDFDKSIIKPEGRVKLDSAVTILNRYSDMRVEIHGHTDSIGTEQYNQGLSERRATAVRDYLVARGIAVTRLTTRGFGETQPVANNGTSAGRAENRRVMLIELR